MSRSRKDRGQAGKRTGQHSRYPKGRILLVESHPGVRYFFTLFLNKGGYRAVILSNGIDALERIVTEEPATFDLILLDWHLRDISSQELCQHIRALPENHEVPIIALMDVDVTLASQQRAPIQAGANATLAKFAHPVQMRKMIRQFI